MRLDAHHGRVRAVLVLGLTFTLAASVAGCSKTWVLDSTPGAGGMAASGSGGAAATSGTGGNPGFGGHGDQGAGGHASCSSISWQYSSPPAELVFVVGRNASMSSKFSDTTRMTAVQMDVHSIVASNPTVAFGYQDFPSFTGCPTGGTCCSSTDDGVTPAIGAMSNIDQMLYHPCDSSGVGMGCVAATDSRAVSQTLAALDVFTSNDSTNDRYIVLITDGPPGCPTEDPGKACGAAQSQVSGLMTHGGIKTYVVGIGDDAQGDSCLQQLATQGGTGTPYTALDSGALMRALSQIANVAAVTCTIDIKVPPDKGLIQVQVQGKEIHYDQTGNTGGWSYDPVPFGNATDRIELSGSACLYLQNSRSAQLAVWSGCPPCTVPSSTCL